MFDDPFLAAETAPRMISPPCSVGLYGQDSKQPNERTIVSKPAVISIIDDDLMVRESTADLIISLGYQALTFDSGEQFLASGCLKDTACIITDLHMPGLNGLDLQSRLLAEGHRTPIIFITAYPKEAARSRALTAGAVAFLSKPFEESALISSLETALEG
jgi:FixJ family two-component response regulator